MLQNRNGQEIAVPESGIKIMHIYSIQLLTVIETWNIKARFLKEKKRRKFCMEFLLVKKAFFLENILAGALNINVKML